MNDILSKAYANQWIKALYRRFPRYVRDGLRSLIYNRGLAEAVWLNEYKRLRKAAIENNNIRSNLKVGILKDRMYRYGRFECACLELGIPYHIIDIYSPKWVDEARRSGVDIIIAYPDVQTAIEKRCYDDRLKLIAEDLGIWVYPDRLSLYLWESKVRQSDWLMANSLPHPRTYIYYERNAAVEFVRNTDYPIVFKTDMGATATGVEIVKDQNHALRLVKRCFGKGYVRRYSSKQDRQWGCILLQEYLTEAREYRVVRIGDSFFGYEKLQKNGFHSGSHSWCHGTVRDEAFNLVRDVTEAHGFRSMSIDLLESNGRLYINELQPLFGMGSPYQQCVINGKEGRMYYDESTDEWVFEEGDFCRNYLCNLRLQDAIMQYEKRVRRNQIIK